MRCITVLYPNEANIRFDFDYYMKNHATLINRVYGAAIARYEVRKGVGSPDGSPAKYVCSAHIYIANQQAFDAAAAKHSAEVVADVAKFTNVMPLIQIDEVL